jgi:hypothetical protein
MELTQFTEEITAQFGPTAIIGSDPPTEEQANGNGFFIQILPVYPTFNDEVDNPFYIPNNGNFRYHVDFALHRRPKVFCFERLYSLKKRECSIFKSNLLFHTRSIPFNFISSGYLSRQNNCP